MAADEWAEEVSRGASGCGVQGPNTGSSPPGSGPNRSSFGGK